MVIPLRDVNSVEKVDSPVGGATYMNAMVVTTKGKVSKNSCHGSDLVTIGGDNV